MSEQRRSLAVKFRRFLLAVPIRIKLAGIVMLPVLILGLSLNYWVRTGLSDWLSYLLSETRIDVAMQVGSRSVILVTVLAAIASILFASTLAFLFTRPILELRKVALQVAGGELDSRALVLGKDEVGEVAVAFNTMIDRLVESRRELEHTNKRLEAMNQVAMAATREVRVQEILDAILYNTLDVMGLQAGWVFLRHPEAGTFDLVAANGLDPQLRDRLLHEGGSNACYCQQALMQGSLGKTATLRDRCIYQQSNGSGRDHQGCQGHVTIPLEAGDIKFGMINLLCQEEFVPSGEEMELLTAIGAQASEIVATAWLRTQLVEKEAARRTLLESLVAAEEDERFRLARELHDGAGQTLTSLLVRLKMLETRAGSEPVRAGLAEMQEHVSATIEEVRALSHRLQPAALEEFGLPLALETLVQEMARESGLMAEVRCDLGNKTLQPETEKMLYRIAQESLTNVVRHAGASRVEVELIAIPYAVCLRIEDDGCGFDPDRLPDNGGERRLGLSNMRERARMLGGSMVIETAPGRGTSVQVRAPLEAEGV